MGAKSEMMVLADWVGSGERGITLTNKHGLIDTYGPTHENN